MAASQRDIASASFSPRTAICWASTTPARPCSPPSRKPSTTRSTLAKRPASCPRSGSTSKPSGTEPLQGRRAGQRPGHPQKADPADLRQAALRLEVSPLADEPRPAGHRHQRRRHVRRADHRQAGEDHLQGLAAQAGPLLRNPDRHEEQQARDPQRQGRRRRHSAGRKGRQIHRQARHRMDRTTCDARHPRDDRAGRPAISAAAAASTNISSRRPSPIRTSRCTIIDPDGHETHVSSGRPSSCRPSRRRSSRIPTASSWAGW